MAASTEPRSGMSYGWTLGENGWNTGMDANLLWLGRFGTQLSVKDRGSGSTAGQSCIGRHVYRGSFAYWCMGRASRQSRCLDGVGMGIRHAESWLDSLHRRRAEAHCL